VPYLLAIWALLIINTLFRSITTRLTTATLTPLPDAQSTLITLPALTQGFTPGQHVRLRVWTMGVSSILESHPFTLASSEGEPVQLIVKRAGDWTEALFALALAGQQPLMRCTVEGPYGGPLNFSFPAFRSVLLIVGGSGGRSSRFVADGSFFRAGCSSWSGRRCEARAHELPDSYTSMDRQR
jgi:ferric-chelate reductase